MNPVIFGRAKATPHPRKPHAYVLLAARDGVAEYRCVCGALRDDAAVRRGRTSLRAGKDGERLVAKEGGMRRVGQYGSPVDVESTWAVGQVKTGGRYSIEDERDLDGMAAYAAGRIRLLFKVNRPGPGNRKRVLVTMRLSEFMEEHGDCLVELDMPDWSDLHRGDGPAGGMA